jgi:hypothetical protein
MWELFQSEGAEKCQWDEQIKGRGKEYRNGRR